MLVSVGFPGTNSPWRPWSNCVQSPIIQAKSFVDLHRSLTEQVNCVSRSPITITKKLEITTYDEGGFAFTQCFRSSGHSLLVPLFLGLERGRTSWWGECSHSAHGGQKVERKGARDWVKPWWPLCKYRFLRNILGTNSIPSVLSDSLLNEISLLWAS